MKIHFCDLCNESVPQSDLDVKQAFMIKGRVVCSKCNALMHSQAAPAEPSSGPFGAGGDPAGGPQGGAAAATLSPPSTSVGTQSGSTPDVQQAHHVGGSHPSHAARSRSSGAGAGLAFLALIGVGVAGWYVFDLTQEVASLRRQVTSADRRLENESLDLAIRLGKVDTRVDEQTVQFEEQSAQRGALLGRTLDQGLEAVRASAEGMQTKLAAFESRIGAMESSIGKIEQHDRELLGLAQKHAALGSELEDLGMALADLADESAALASSGVLPAQGVAPVPQAAAWMGLVAQLESTEDGDRWQAVIALGETRDPAVAPYLIPVLADSDIFVRMAAARMLGDLGSPEAIPGLIDGLEDPEPSVREAVYLALKEITRRDLPFDALSDDAGERSKRVQAWRDWWEKEKDRIGG